MKTGIDDTCIIVNCNNKVYKKRYCSRHYYQQYKHNGKILNRTRFDSNVFRIYYKKVKMITYDIKGIAKIETEINITSIEQLQKHKWYSFKSADGIYHVRTSINKKKIPISLYLYSLYKIIPANYVLAYKDKNTLNNKMDNFILRTYSELAENMKLSKANKSGTKGVSMHKCGKWQANINKNGKRKYLGLFDNKEDAIAERLKAEKEYFTSKD